MANFCETGIVVPTLAILRLLFAFGILFYMNPMMAGVCVATFPILVLVTRIIHRHSRKLYRQIQEQNEQLNGRVAEVFGGIRIVRSFQSEEREKRLYAEGDHKIQRLRIKVAVLQQLSQ